jgi:hypothetical protein
MTAVAACRTCGTEPLDNARFCHSCGSPVQDGDAHAEYKQATVLFIRWTSLRPSGAKRLCCGINEAQFLIDRLDPELTHRHCLARRYSVNQPRRKRMAEGVTSRKSSS